MADHKFGIETLCLHAGQIPDPITGARAVPIYQTTSYVFDDAEHAASLFNLQTFGNTYVRLTNPTTAVFEERMATLENGRAALGVSSGMAAQMTAILTLMEQGDELVSAKTLYGGTFSQFDVTFRKMGIETTFVDSDDPENFRKAITSKTKALYAEIIGNPTNNVIDIEAIAAVAHDAGIPLIVDNTSATPYLCRPIELGATLVVHSTTKYLSGTGTVMGGVVVDSGKFDWSASDKFPSLSQPEPAYHGLKFHETFGSLAFTIHGHAVGLRDLGSCQSPQNAFITLLGIETLSLRMDKHVANAVKVATWLEGDPRVASVTYAGLKSSPYYRRGRKLCPKGAGALFTFQLKGGYDVCKKLVDSVELFSHVANLGDARSLIIHSASTTHRQLSDEQRARAGAANDMVRLSIGIEDADDLIADLDQAMTKATA